MALTVHDKGSIGTPFAAGVIADDMTGALDTGVQFAQAGLKTILSLSVDDCTSLPVKSSQVRVLSTDSRDGDRATARQSAVRAARQLRGCRWLYKKIDSTMRGHIGIEIEAILEETVRHTTRPMRAVVCPGVISQGRTIREGRLYVGETLLHASEFARDPRWPATTSDMVELLGVPATHLPLKSVRAGPQRLTQSILNAPTSIVTVDAVKEADIQCAARAAVLGRCLPCGALGLARAWIECLIADSLVAMQQAKEPIAPRPRTPTRSGDPILVVAGSRHPATRAQLQRAAHTHHLTVIEAAVMNTSERASRWTKMAETLAAGRTVIVRSPLQEIRQPSERRILNETIADWTTRACRAFKLGGLVLTGGQTAQTVCRALEATAIDILGELEAGIPWGQLAGGVGAGLQVVTKAGGFGHPDSLVRVLNALCLELGE